MGEPAGHEQEIILVGLQVGQNDGPPATDICRAFGQALGSALLTPSDLNAAGYSADPGRVALGQLWRCRATPA